MTRTVYDHHDPDNNTPLDFQTTIDRLDIRAASYTITSGIPHACQEAIRQLRHVQALTQAADKEHGQQVDDHARACQLEKDGMVTAGFESVFEGATSAQFLRIFKGSEEV